MLRNLATLFRYRGLIQSLVARELKARYRGSVLGFFWSFINPLMLLLVYSFVFSYVMPAAHDSRIEPYALFMFCGILPWTWFSSSLSESANVLIGHGNIIPGLEKAMEGHVAGDKFEASKIRLSAQNLYNLGFFDEVNPEVEPASP